MIRINLYGRKPSKSSGSKSSGASSSAMSSGAAGGGDAGLLFEEENINKDALVNLLILLLPALLLYAYQMQHIPGLQSQLSAQQQELYRLQEENLKNQEVADEIKRFNEEKAVLEGQIAAIRKLSDGRMNIVKSIEAVQNAIPTKIWLNSILLTGQKLRIDGTALTDLDISGFMEKISGSSHMSNIELLEADQAKIDVIGNVKKFSINASLEEN